MPSSMSNSSKEELMELPSDERRYFFIAGDKIVIPEACYVVFFSPDGQVIHPELKAVMRVPISTDKEED